MTFMHGLAIGFVLGEVFMILMIFVGLWWRSKYYGNGRL